MLWVFIHSFIFIIFLPYVLSSLRDRLILWGGMGARTKYFIKGARKILNAFLCYFGNFLSCTGGASRTITKYLIGFVNNYFFTNVSDIEWKIRLLRMARLRKVAWRLLQMFSFFRGPQWPRCPRAAHLRQHLSYNSGTLLPNFLDILLFDPFTLILVCFFFYSLVIAFHYSS